MLSQALLFLQKLPKSKVGPHKNNPKSGDDDCEQYFLLWELQ